MTVETVSDGAAGVRLLRAGGELDIAVAPDLVGRVPELVEGAAGVVLDLRAVTFLDSAGIRLLDGFARECGRRRVGFAAVAPTRAGPRRILEIVGFGPPLIVEELSTAIESVSPHTA
jgi:anti-sigma B factor antagonist